MKIFTPIYDRVLQWARHRHATRILAAVSFFESIIFPIPVAVMLLPMSLSTPQRAWRLATITLIFSVLGGIVGYWIGWGAFELVEPMLKGHQETILRAQQWFREYGILIVLVAGFSPIPYKIFTLTAGSAAMPFIPFVLASIVARASQFFLIAGLVKWLGPTMEPKIRQVMEWLGWGFVILIAAVVAWLQFSK